MKKIIISNEGYVHCHSCFYDSQDILSSKHQFVLSTGINRLYGEIDSGMWAISYLLSMYAQEFEDFILFEQPEVIIDNSIVSLKDVSKYSCYMDRSYSLFSSNESVSEIISNMLKQSELNYTLKYIKELFQIDYQRLEYPLTNSGNEIFKIMAAIGYCCGKEIFCFPWLSKRRFDSYHSHLTTLLDILEELEKIVILPLGITI